jgi:hypothetical protein
MVAGVQPAATLFALAVIFCSMLCGCSHITKRGQSPDDEAMQFNEGVDKPTYIGDVAGPVGLEKLSVEGIGLVEDLEGTGSDAAPSAQRDYLINEIKTHDIDNVADLLASTGNSMVTIRGQIPAGARSGDRFDLYVQCPPKSETTSLEGGFLLQARLKPMMVTSRSVQIGHNFGLGQGRVLVNRIFDSRDESQNMISGVIPGGGVVIRDREAGLRLVDGARSIHNTTSMARAINARFTARVSESPEGVANPTSDRTLEILIPDEYRNNIGRYFHVLLNIVFEETPDQRINRLELLERQLHDPATTSIAAIRLEAVGEDSIGALKRGLRSDDFEVQFHAAQALAYMGDDSGVDILGKAVAIEPAFRWHGLTALESLRNVKSEQMLVSLFDAKSAEARYGAFRALRESMPGSPYADGDFVNREFMLHSLSTSATPMIHFTRDRVPEIVLFGADQKFNENLLYIDRGLTIRSAANDRVELIRYRSNEETRKLVCSSVIADVIRNAASLGCDYGDMLKLVKDAVASDAMEMSLVVNAVPQLNRSYRGGVQPGEMTSDPADGYMSDEMPAGQDDVAEDGDKPNAGTARGIFGKLGFGRKR